MSVGAVSSSAASVAFSLTQIQTAADFAALAVSQDTAVATQGVLAASGALASSPDLQSYTASGSSATVAGALASVGNALNIAI
jgi:hypothetical protein